MNNEEKTVTITETEYLALKFPPKPNRPRCQTVDLIPGEIWKVIEDTNDLYYISNLGRLRKTYEAKTGMMKDFLLSNPKRTAGCTAKLSISPTYQINTYIHHLVLKAFHPLPGDSPKMSVMHLDCDISNNRLDNLKWATHSEAILHKKNCGAIKPKLKTKQYISKAGKKAVKQVWFSDADIKRMKELKAQGVISQAGIADIFRCSQTYVSKVVNDKIRND